MPNTEPAGIHDTATCNAGPGGGPCELCEWAESKPYIAIDEPQHDCDWANQGRCDACDAEESDQTEKQESIGLRNLRSIVHHAEMVTGQARGLKCCERCDESDRQEGAQREQQRPTFSEAAIRLALAGTLDEADDGWGWMFTASESDDETETRVRFIDAVVERLRQLTR